MNNDLTTSLPTELLSATSALADNLAHALPIVTYYRAQADLGTDIEASGLLQRYSQAVTDWRARQARGEATPVEAEQMRALQQAVRANPTIGAVAQSQQAAPAYLREINGEISQLLGFDFAAFARRAGCC